MGTFEHFLTELNETNATLGFFVDFDKVNNHVRKIEVKLNQLNYLLGKSDLDNSIRELYEENPSVFSVLNILVAVREKGRKVNSTNDGVVSIDSYSNNVGKICEYIYGTGLSEVFKNKKITNLVDYVFGIEVGLDTNARKNRSGKQMGNAVSDIFKRHNINFEEEVSSTKINGLSVLGVDVKHFDFLITTPVKKYLIEVNYYSGGGSKLNEVARSYTDVSKKINSTSEYEFVWITDGQGWFSAKNKLEGAFNAIPRLYNLTSISEFIQHIKSEL
jgi:type II restriction enzyme